MKADPRIIELAERMMASGPKCSQLSASEVHEVAEFILTEPEDNEGDFCRIERHPKVGQVLIKKINDSESDDPEMSIEFVTPDFIRLTLEISCRSEEGRDQLFEEMTGEKLITRIESVTGELGL